MQKDLEDKLFADFPNLYKNHQRCFECDDGWYQLLRDLSANLELLVLQIPEKDREEFYVAVVKEKLGSLRFDCNYPYDYDHFLVDRFYAFIDEAESKSETICEDCGQPGALKKFGHLLRVNCPDCEKQRNAK